MHPQLAVSSFVQKGRAGQLTNLVVRKEDINTLIQRLVAERFAERQESGDQTGSASNEASIALPDGTNAMNANQDGLIQQQVLSKAFNHRLASQHEATKDITLLQQGEETSTSGRGKSSKRTGSFEDQNHTIQDFTQCCKL